MPATTRSRTKQTTLEDIGAGSPKSSGGEKRDGSASQSTNASSKKRKAGAAGDENVKETKASKISSSVVSARAENENVITINRAPVLELWAASVAQFLHPKMSWDTCLSVGGAISTITAISKGRSIGAMSKPDPGEAEAKRQKRRENAEKEQLSEAEVMSFHLHLDANKHALVGDKPKKPAEEALKNKFGDQAYGKAKSAFTDALQGWKGKEDELDSRAFSMYEDFRPTVPPGQKGWGRKGQLNLETINTVVGDS